MITTYRLGTLSVDVSPTQDRTIRAARGLGPDEPLLEALRTEAWEALTTAGDESEHWGRVRVS
ncbi:hypothetical protein [Nocardiopsis synnemataformans]|uniref:hypothetical protein n=1 Tax=Nocardiopsis synnemataformans TaxID=61305 RepID=UPI003EB9939B